jgi:hypothetical protein
VSDIDRDAKIGRQIQLPFSKAVEISLKSLRVRFWRSMLTVGSIILAIAFLTYVWTSSRVKSNVAVHVRPDVAKVNALIRDVDQHWAVLADELAERFGTSRMLRNRYREELKWLLAGRTGQFKAFCNEQQLEYKRVALDGLPFSEDNTTTIALADRARELGLMPDVDGWPSPGLELAGIKGVVQAEVDRFNALRLALQRGGVSPDDDEEELEKLDEATVWLIVISLLVCGVGITNAMLMSVTERFREIGTMKCLGALDSFIIKLFLLESVFQGVAGTMFGVVLGLMTMSLASLSAFGMATIDYFPTAPVLWIALYGLLIGSALSIVAAVFPALRAAHMAPVEAMRVEE